MWLATSKLVIRISRVSIVDSVEEIFVHPNSNLISLTEKIGKMVLQEQEPSDDA